MNRCLAMDVRQAEHDEQDRLMAEFLAGGGEVVVIPRGVSGENLTPRQRLNPPILTKAEREARKARDQAIVPKRIKGPVERKPRERKVREPKVRVKNGPDFAQVGTQKGEILRLLSAGPLRSEQIAERLGIKVESVRANLHVLKSRGKVSTSGRRREFLWSACP